MPAQTPPGDQALRPGDQAIRPGLDHTLLTRLWQRAEQPGCVRHSQARVIVARHQRMAGGPLLAGLLLQRGRSSADTLPARPVIVDARPAGVTPLPGHPSPPGGAPYPEVPRPAARARRTPPDESPASPSPVGAMTPPSNAAQRNSLGDTAQRQPSAQPQPSAQRPSAPPARPVAVTPIQPAADNAPTVTNGTSPGQTGPQPGAGPRPEPHPSVRPVPLRPPLAPSPAAPPTAPPAQAAPVTFADPPLAIARPVPRGSVPPRGPGPEPTENERPVVRPGTHGLQLRPAALAWPRPAPDQAAGYTRRSVPVVREQVSPAAWRLSPPVAQRPGQLPFAALPPDRADHVGWADHVGRAGRAVPAPDRTLPAPIRATPAAARTQADPAGLAVQAREAARAAAPRTPPEPPEPPPDRQAGLARHEREPARPAVDINQIVSTVQRRLMHQMAIERERRGMAR
jgi:hypothetical protein